MKSYFFTLILTISVITSFSQQDSLQQTSNKAKTGFGFGALPTIAYDSDLGFKYGGLINVYHYGDGSRYPKYNHSLYLEWSRTTKGSGTNQIIYDSDMLIPNIRLTAEVSYITEKALNFYGFNGFEAFYNKDFETSKTDNLDYISRMFYRLDRKSFRVKADFQGNIYQNKFKWLAGIEYHGTEIASVDIDELNKGVKEKDKLPKTNGLYDYYVDWGVLKKSDKSGGNNAFLKLGLVFDTRDIEANPSKGVWDEIILFTGPQFFGFENFTLSALFMHRQYFTIIPQTLTFAYRLAYKTKLTGDIPFYLLPYFTDSKQIADGFGGYRTIRGIYRDRLVADGVALGNFEFRYKFLKTKLFKQNFYIALSTFLDAGRTITPYKINTTNVPKQIYINNRKYDPMEWFNHQPESFHIGYGLGLHFALNENFIIAIDYGFAFNKNDGKNGLYIDLNWLF